MLRIHRPVVYLLGTIIIVIGVLAYQNSGYEKLINYYYPLLNLQTHEVDVTVSSLTALYSGFPNDQNEAALDE
jgi:hypothetical protein